MSDNEKAPKVEGEGGEAAAESPTPAVTATESSAAESPATEEKADSTGVDGNPQASRNPQVFERTKKIAWKFHRASHENELCTDAHRVCSKLAVGTIWFAGLHGRWRAPCGRASRALRAKWLGYGLGARCTACLAIIP